MNGREGDVGAALAEAMRCVGSGLREVAKGGRLRKAQSRIGPPKVLQGFSARFATSSFEVVLAGAPESMAAAAASQQRL